MNIYGPYTNRKDFWEKFGGSGIIDFQNIIIVGDLNFTMANSECLGLKVRLDPLSSYSKALFASRHLKA